MDVGHIISAEYAESGYYKTRPVFQYDYGQVLRLEGFEDLPEFFEVHFGNHVRGKAVTQVGSSMEVTIPDECLLKNQPVFAWLFLHDTEGDGKTVFIIEIPVIARAMADGRKPTPVEQDAITQTLAALSEAVEGVKSGEYIPVADVTNIIENYEGS